MDWKTFVSSIVASLAWPLLVGTFLFAVRGQLPQLLARLKGASFGNNKFEFSEALQRGREEQEAVAADHPDAEESSSRVDDVSLELANQFPEAAVMRAYKDVESILLEIRKRLDLPPRTNLRGVVRRLVERDLIDAELEPLFSGFQQARNVAVHAGQGARISPGEALEYASQARFLRTLFLAAQQKL